MKNSSDYLISLIIPAYKQEETIRRDIFHVKEVMDNTRYAYEIIVVIDGNIDRSFENAKKIKEKNILVVGYADNRGKGFAIRYGVTKAKGDIIGFIDAGLDLSPNGLSLLLEDFEWYNADIIVGSKRHPRSKVNYPLDRQVISFFSQVFIRILFGLNVRDTQVGMKFFSRQVIEDVMPRLLVKKFAFDIEILVVAYHLGYRQIYEAPIDLNFNSKGSIVSQSLFNALFKTFWDALAIFYRLRIMHYYDSRNKKGWKYDPELNFRVNLPR